MAEENYVYVGEEHYMYRCNALNEELNFTFVMEQIEQNLAQFLNFVFVNLRNQMSYFLCHLL